MLKNLENKAKLNQISSSLNVQTFWKKFYCQSFNTFKPHVENVEHIKENLFNSIPSQRL